MKKRITVMLAGALAAAMLLAGCQASKGLETDELKISQYKEVEVAKVEDKEEVTDETVESTIQSMLEEQAETTEVKDRAVKDGDITNIDFTGKIDGKEFDGGSMEGYDLTIGSDSFIDGFEDSIIGHKKGDEFDWEGKFPDDYQNADYAGKDVTFTIKINSIQEKNIPELTDKMVAELSETSKTVEEYKKEVKKELEESAEETYNSNLYTAVWQAVLENTDVKKYPDGEKEKMAQKLTENYEQIAKTYGMDFEEFLETSMGMTKEQFDEQVQKAAEENVKSQMATAAIAKEEKIDLDDETYEKELEKIAAQYGYESADSMKEQVDEEDLKNTALNNIVVDWVAERCIQKAE